MKRKFAGYRVQGTGFIIFIVFLSFYILPTTSYQLPVFAQDVIESKEASGGAILGDKSLLEKINALKEEIASKASTLKLEVAEKIQNKAIPGTVEDLDSEVILLITKNGEKKIVINEYTLFETDSDEPSLEDIAKEDYIVALGDLDDKGNLVAKKIVKLEKPKEENKKFYSGEVTDLVSSTITLKTKSGKKDIVVTSSTVYGAGKDEALFDDIKVGKKIVVVGVPNPAEVITGDFIYIMPQGNPIPLPTKEASPSASPEDE